MTMNTYQETMRKLYDPENHEVLIASHRGKFSSSVMENTSLAFLTAIGEGADMVEMDLEETKDGRIVGHHDDHMKRLFHNDGRISDYTLEELKAMPVYNYVGEICVEGIETFEEILDSLKDKTILVLDKCWDCWDKVYALLKEKNMVDQTIFKFYLKDEEPMVWAKAHKDCIFIPMCGDPEMFPKLLELREHAGLPAVEILPHAEDEPIFSDETFRWLEEHHIKVWCNSLSLARRLVYGAGYDDLKSLRYGGDKGWGVLIDKGVQILQTDWPYEVACYLKEKKMR